MQECGSIDQCRIAEYREGRCVKGLSRWMSCSMVSVGMGSMSAQTCSAPMRSFMGGLAKPKERNGERCVRLKQFGGRRPRVVQRRSVGAGRSFTALLHDRSILRLTGRCRKPEVSSARWAEGPGACTVQSNRGHHADAGDYSLHVVETVLENDTDGQMTCVPLTCLSHVHCRTDRTPRPLFRGEDLDLRVGGFAHHLTHDDRKTNPIPWGPEGGSPPVVRGRPHASMIDARYRQVLIPEALTDPDHPSSLNTINLLINADRSAPTFRYRTTARFRGAKSPG